MTRTVRVPAVRRAFLDLGAHGRVPFLVASDPLEAWVACEPSPRFLWRAFAPVTAYSYRLAPKGYYAPMNVYRDGPFGGKVLRRVVLVMEGAK